MTAQVNWTVNNMKRNTADGGVTIVYWECVATDDTETDCRAVEAGKLRLEPDASSDGFVAYDSLTQEIVLGWVQSYLNDNSTDDQNGESLTDSVEEIETRLKGKIDKQVAAKTAEATGTPWGTSDSSAA